MDSEDDFAKRFWKSIKSDMTAMLETSDIPSRAMTAQFDGGQKMIYFFTSKDSDLGQVGSEPISARLLYASKNHDLFANVEGTLHANNDTMRIDRLWNRFVAAWFEGGQTDPKLCLLHFQPGNAKIWKDASSLVAGAKLFLGLGDPKEEYANKVDEVDLNRAAID